MDNSHQYVFIVAGGAGTRLWPVSRQKRPKQFQSFTDGETLLQHMVKLSTQVVPIERTFIMAIPEFAGVIGEQVPDLPTGNLLFEPARRDNGPAITLGMLEINQRDPEAVVAILWADHLIQQPERFSEVLKTGLAASQDHPSHLVTIGAKPLYPDPNLGYIQVGQRLDEYEQVPTFTVNRFVEKPDLATATSFVDSGEYFWNLGYKIMGTRAYLEAWNRVQPDLQADMDRLEAAVAAGNHAKIAEAYERFPKLSIEHTFTPFLTDLLVVCGDLGWSDVGNWNALHDILKEREGSDFITRGDVLNLNSSNCLVFAKDRRIVTVGVKDLVIVDEGDALLIMDRSSTPKIKDVTKTLEETNRTDLL